MRGRGRLGVTLAALVPMLGVFVLAGWTTIATANYPRLACRLLPNQVVPLLADLSGGCPLRAYDRVAMLEIGGEQRYVRGPADLERALASATGSVRLRVDRPGGSLWLDVPVVESSRAQLAGRFAAVLLLCALLMTMALATLWRSTAAAAAPFVGLYASLAVFLVSALCGSGSTVLAWTALVAAGGVPACLAHLALAFPREALVLRSTPRLAQLPYLVCGSLAAVGVVSMLRQPVLWGAVDRILLGAALLAWAGVVARCLLAWRAARSALERARARVLVMGTAIVPSLCLVLGTLSGDALPGGTLGWAALSALLLPLPLGYAIVRQRLFDLDHDVRRALAFLSLQGGSAAAVTLAGMLGAALFGWSLPLGEPLVLFGVAFLGFALLDPLRTRLRALLEVLGTRDGERLQQVGAAFGEQMAELRDPEECMRLLCRTAREGLAARGVACFSASADGLLLTAASGVLAADEVRAARAARLLARAAEHVVALREEEFSSSEEEELQRDGIELVGSLRFGAESYGLVLVAESERGLPYTGSQVGLLRVMVAQAALALHNGTLARDLAAAERFAALGSISAGLIHELGKPLGVLERLAERLPARLDDPSRTARDARAIADVAGGLRRTLRGLLADPRMTGSAEGRLALPELLERACGEVARLHGGRRVALRMTPGLPTLPLRTARLERVVINLLDNALRAGAPEDVVELVASVDGDEFRIEVVDRGCGMEPEVLRRAFEPFFTTRAPQEGSGIGLTLSSQIVVSLGGRIELASSRGSGSSAVVRLPLRALVEQETA